MWSIKNITQLLDTNDVKYLSVLHVEDNVKLFV